MLERKWKDISGLALYDCIHEVINVAQLFIVLFNFLHYFDIECTKIH